METPIVNKTALDNVDQEVLASTVLAKLMAELNSLPEAELLQVNLDIPAAVATVLGALPEIRAQRARIAAEIPSFDLTTFDKMEEYALALNAAHASFLAATGPSAELTEVVEEAARLRDVLLTDASAMVKRGLLSARSVEDLKGAVGHKNVATDLLHLVQAIRSRWTVVASRSAVTAAELDRAERVQQRVLRLVGLREQGAPTVASSSELRQRAFTRFTHAWDDVRRAITFLRWRENDIDDHAPSLYAGRGGSRKKATEVAPLAAPPASTTAGATQGVTAELHAGGTQPQGQGSAAQRAAGAQVTQATEGSPRI
jgi:hypothetical protein